jgi:hypothetical protein
VKLPIDALTAWDNAAHEFISSEIDWQNHDRERTTVTAGQLADATDVLIGWALQRNDVSLNLAGLKALQKALTHFARGATTPGRVIAVIDRAEACVSDIRAVVKSLSLDDALPVDPVTPPEPREDPVSPPVSGYLGLIVDMERGEVRREGKNCTVNFQTESAEWYWFATMFRCGDRGATSDQIAANYPTSSSSHAAMRQARARVVDKLYVLGVGASRGYPAKLVDQNADVTRT